MTVTPHGWRRRDARAIYEQHHGPNMTPMVDVVMVILIFFMASTVIMGPELLLNAGLDATKPTERGEAPGDPAFAIAPPSFTVRLFIEGDRVAASGLGLDGAALPGLVGAARRAAREIDAASAAVVIVPEDEVPYEAVIAAQDALMDAGFTAIRLR